MNEHIDGAASDGPTRVMVVDDHQVIRQAMVRMLAEEPGLRVVAECGDGRQAIAQISEARPEVVVMDLTMPVMGGVEAIGVLSRRHPEVGVLAVSMCHDRASIRAALQAGARGFVSKQVPSGSLCRAIHAVAGGYCHLNVPAQHASLSRSQPVPSRDARSRGHRTLDLEPREREVLRLVALGHTGREISERLGISAKNLDNHRARLLSRLGLSHRRDVLLYALEHGLIGE